MSEKTLAQSNAPQISFLLFLVLGAIGALTPLAIDMLPAMPTIARDLGVSKVCNTDGLYGRFCHWSVNSWPASRQLWAKTSTVVRRSVFGLASVVSATTTGIEALTWYVLPGLCRAAAAVIIQAVVRDMFDREDFARAMSFVTLVMTIAPLIAPMIGGYVAVWLGWRAIFWILMPLHWWSLHW